MTTRTLLLTLHLAAVAAWLGANFTQMVLTPRFARESPAVAAAWTRHTMWLGERYYNAAGALIAVSGVLLVLDGDWSWNSKFIWVGIAVIIIGGALGGLVFAPLARKRLAALESGDSAGASAAMASMLRWAALDTILVITAVLAMVYKWRTA